MKKIYIILTAVCLLVLVFIGSNLFTSNSNSDKVANSINNASYMDVNFANNYISYVLEEGTTLQLNLFGAQNVSSKGPSYFDSVKNISLDNESIEIIDYEISKGQVFQTHQLFNIVLEVKLNSSSMEKSSQLTLRYEEGEEATFDIGRIILQDNQDFNQKELDVTGEENTLAAPVPLLSTNLLNKTSNDLEVNNIYDLAKNLDANLREKYIINSGQVKKLVITDFDKATNYDFYTITPIVEYKIDGEIKKYYLPGVVYGIMEEDSVKMEKILE
ncbi:hypothetical protein [Rossellomorea marisflavi]|uniref:hypothetical protein n=1 Tax=Rossellomorea marisflavi TaxID=189381 RepID=UPI00064FBC3A|nr:hypothetical protein [Rossellomorea marisflavi]KMK91845.1 hypothetical protein VL03_17955 [Rossellomorea marisflavi]